MKVISVINLKGGVAKTFTAYNMAYELAKRGYTVLLLDNDKQGNLSKAAGAYESTGVCAAARAITGEYKNPLKDLIVEHPQCNNIDIIPANMSLMQAVWQIGNSTGNQIDSYEKMINTPMTSIDSPFPNTARDYYDYMIIDNPPDIAYYIGL